MRLSPEEEEEEDSPPKSGEERSKPPPAEDLWYRAWASFLKVSGGRPGSEEEEEEADPPPSSASEEEDDAAGEGCATARTVQRAANRLNVTSREQRCIFGFRILEEKKEELIERFDEQQKSKRERNVFSKEFQ